MTFGCYCLNNIGYALYTFRDCPEAYNELMGVRQRIDTINGQLVNHLNYTLGNSTSQIRLINQRPSMLNTFFFFSHLKKKNIYTHAITQHSHK